MEKCTSSPAKIKKESFRKTDKKIIRRFKETVYRCNYKEMPQENRQEERDIHRRRIYTEEKAKVVTAVWGTECIPFLAAL